MENLIANAVNLIFAVAGVGLSAAVLVRIAAAYIAKEKTVAATVIKKQTVDKQVYPKSQTPYMQKKYLVTFLCGTKKRTFCVSELSYRHYAVGLRGYVTYKGHRLIDFETQKPW